MSSKFERERSTARAHSIDPDRSFAFDGAWRVWFVAEKVAERGRAVSGERSGREGTVGAEILVEGRVQGVGFRDFARREAERAGLVGYAMNLDDGTVRVVVEGARAAIDTLVPALEAGPRLARVTRVSVDWTAARGQFTSFSIRYSGRDA